LLIRLSKANGIPLSTLKLHSRKLRELGLLSIVDLGPDCNIVALTDDGNLVLSIISGHDQ